VTTAEVDLQRRVKGAAAAVGFGLSAPLLSLIRPADAIEGSLRFDSQWARQLDGWLSSPRVSHGVSTWAGFPIWDMTQGVGQRFGNQMSGFSRHPAQIILSPLSGSVTSAVLVASYATAYFLLLHEVLRRRMGTSRLSLQVLCGLPALSSLIALSVTKDWSANAIGSIGLLTMVLIPLLSNGCPRNGDGVSVVTLFVASSALTAGHPRFLASAPAVALCMTICAPRRIATFLRRVWQSTTGKAVVALIGLLMVQAYLEFASVTAAVRQPYESIWDFLQPHRLQNIASMPLYVAFALLVGAIHPFLWLLQGLLQVSEHLTGRNDFVFWPAIASALVRIRQFDRSSAQRQACLLVCRIWLSLVLLLACGGPIRRLGGPQIGRLMSYDAWDLTPPIFFLACLGFALSVGNHTTNGHRTAGLAGRTMPWLSRSIAVTALGAVVVPLLFTFALDDPLTDRNVRERTWDAPRSTNVRAVADHLQLPALRRWAFIPPVEQGESGGYRSLHRYWQQVTGLPHALVASRAGFPSIAAVHGYSADGLFTSDDMEDADPSACSKVVADFLGLDSLYAFRQPQCLSDPRHSTVKWISACIGVNACRTDVEFRSFSGSDVVRESDLVISRPALYHTFLLGTEREPCPQATGGLLCGIVGRLKPGLPLENNPLKICETKSCAVTYEVRTSDPRDTIIVPLRHDDRLRATRSDGESVTLGEHGGFVTVDANEIGSSDLLRFAVHPTWADRTSIAIAWVHTLMMGAVALFIAHRAGPRGRRPLGTRVQPVPRETHGPRA
jgi:hypothetical protein